MKTFSITILAAAVFGLTGCSGGDTAANTNAARTTNANANTAVVVNSNANAPASNVNSNADTSGAMTDPSGFMMEAARGGLAEVEAGKLAASKAANAEVKQFAQQMTADHTRANNELKALAAKKNVTLPTEPDAAHKTMTDTLSKLSGAEFDREYMRGQVADHEKTVNLFQAQADGGTDPDAKAWAAKMLPALKMHLDMARKINDKLK